MYFITRCFIFLVLLIFFTLLLSSNHWIRKTYAQDILNITRFNIPTTNSTPISITKGSDGNLWFTEQEANKIGRVTTDGNFQEFIVPTNQSGLFDITLGPDGNLWFTEYAANKIGRITQQGTITEYSLPNGSTSPFHITSGPDGNLWFTENVGNKIGKITPEGIITEYLLPQPRIIDSALAGITAGPDGNIWFTEVDNYKVGKITPDGEITEYYSGTGRPMDITQGLDGNLWYTESGFKKIAKITTTGSITEFPIPSDGSTPNSITVGPDGKIWYLELNNQEIGKVTYDGTITVYAVPDGTFLPYDITSGPDGNIWFTESGRNTIDRINLKSKVDFKQTDPLWGSAHLGDDEDCGDMYGFGCAVTSVADVFVSYGKTLLANTSLQMNPGTLNAWLGKNKGFSACSIIWGNAVAAGGLEAPQILFRNDSTFVNGAQAINHALEAGNLPILGINTKFGTHFLVVSERLPQIDGKPDYKLVDPALYPFVQNALGNTGKSLSEAYGGFDKVFETIIYKKDSKLQRSITIRAHSPVQLKITDPSGLTTGYDASTQTIVNEINKSTYGVEGGIAPVDGSSPAGDETKYFQVVSPVEGAYTLSLIGTGDGTYSMDFSKTDEFGNVMVQELHGIARNRVTETFDFQSSYNASDPLVINKTITFQNVKDNITKLASTNDITQKSVANSLIRNLEQAEKANLSGDNAKILQNIDQASSILERERGRKITEKAYKILFDDITFLKRQYITSVV